MPRLTDFLLRHKLAAYGVLVLVWQEGHGSEAVWGVPATGAIAMWVPLMAFAFLYGLSMDYEVFLLARMREEYDATGSTSTAIVQGLGRVGRLVTCAALLGRWNWWLPPWAARVLRVPA